jgi:hypothetical protein
MGWDKRVARATRLVCQAALMTDPVLYAGHLASLDNIDVVAPHADRASDARAGDEVGTSTAARPPGASRTLAWR